MKAIVEQSEEECGKLNDKMAVLHFFDCEKYITFRKTSGYAHYKFSGEVTHPDIIFEALGRNLTSSEIILLVDGGYSHFGAQCSYDTKAHKFGGRINTD